MDKKLYVERYGIDENFKIINILSTGNDLFFRAISCETSVSEDGYEKIVPKRGELKLLSSFSEDGFNVNEENLLELEELIKSGFKLKDHEMDSASFYLMERYAENEKMFDFLFTKDVFYGRISRYSSDNENFKRFNYLYNMLTIPMNNMEKLIGSLNEKTFFDNIIMRKFELSDGRKVKQLLNLPTRVINIINEKYKNSLESFQEIGRENGNDANLFLDFLEKVYPNECNDPNIIKTIADIVKMKRFNMNVLLKYIIRQSYYSSWTRGSDPFYNGAITRIANELKDTMTMFYKINDTKDFELPIDLQFEHYVQTKNYNLIFKTDEEKDIEFKRAVEQYKNLEYFNEKYSLIVPESIKELGREGSILRHCVASYVDKITNGTSIVLFLRKKNKISEPFVTVEVDEDFNLLQVKTYGDADVEDAEVYDFLNDAAKKFEKERMKKSGKKVH